MQNDDAGDDDRERYRELLEELRTIIPGVQVLFGFLLTAPFSSRFEAVDDLGVQVFAVALLCVGLATVVLMTPAAYHRVSPGIDRSQRVRLGIRVTIVGMALLAVAVGAAVFVVGRLIFQTQSAPPAGIWSPTTIGIGIAALIAGLAALLWFVLPLVRRRTGIGEGSPDR